jgi:AcrR family transcriptional regulator
MDKYMRVKSEERRQAILNTAKEEFTRQGFSQTSMSAIAKKVGGSKATLYNYFSSKEEIFTAVMDSVADQMTIAFESLSTTVGIKPALFDFGCQYLTSLYSPELAMVTKMAYTEADKSDLGRHFFENGPKKGLAHLQRFLTYHVENRALKPCDTGIAALQLRALLEAELREQFALGIIGQPDRQTIQDVVERAVDSFLTLYRAGD